MGKIISIDEINRAVMEGKDDLVMSKARYSSVSVAQAAPVRRMPST